MGKAYYYKGMPILAPFKITSNEPYFDMTTVSLKTQRASQGYQRWELTFNVVSTAETEVDALLSTMVDFESTDSMIMPQLPSVVDSITLNLVPDVASTASVGSTTVYLDNTNIEGVIPKGCFIKFNNHDKVYIVTETANFTGTVDVPLKIYPGLTKSVSAVNKIEINDSVVFTYYRSIDNQVGIQFTDGVLSNPGTITLIEAL